MTHSPSSAPMPTWQLALLIAGAILIVVVILGATFYYARTSRRQQTRASLTKIENIPVTKAVAADYQSAIAATAARKSRI